MSEQLPDLCERHALLEQPGRVGVAQVVDRRRRDGSVMGVTVTIPAAQVEGRRWTGMFGDLTPAVPRFRRSHGGDLLVVFDADTDEETAAAVVARLLKPHQTTARYAEQVEQLVDSTLARPIRPTPRSRPRRSKSSPRW